MLQLISMCRCLGLVIELLHPQCLSHVFFQHVTHFSMLRPPSGHLVGVLHGVELEDHASLTYSHLCGRDQQLIVDLYVCTSTRVTRTRIYTLDVIQNSKQFLNEESGNVGFFGIHRRKHPRCSSRGMGK